MIGIHRKVVDEAILSFKDNIRIYNDEALTRLNVVKQDYGNTFSNDENIFLDKLIAYTEANNLMSLDLRKIKKLKKKLGNIPDPPTKLNTNKKVYLKHKIKWALNYTKLRREFFPEYFQKIGIKSCVYCNSQLTVIIDQRLTTAKARFQVDHYFPQAEFPYLSISLFNLYPTCGSCNHTKSDDFIDFPLYLDQITESKYTFSLKKGSLSDYMTSKDCNDLEIEFNDPDEAKSTSLEKKLHISSIYATQKDLAEEIILRAYIYNDAYKESLQKSFPDLLVDKAVIERMLTGNHVDPKDIHKRPMAKFTQDIIKEIKANINKEQRKGLSH